MKEKHRVMVGGDLRGGIHKILEEGKYGVEPLGHKLEVAVPHVVHEINIRNVADKRYNRSCSGENHGQQWY